MRILAAACTAVITACNLFPDAGPIRLRYDVVPTNDGARVSVTVSGGPRPLVWVGFGTSPLGGASTARVINNVTARSVSGSPLVVEHVDADAYRVQIEPDEDWVLDYRATVGAPPADFYHRASSRSDDHLILLGVDVWARFFDDPTAVELAPADRPLGEVEAATVRFDTTALPRGRVVVSAAREIEPDHFVLREHPARSAFAVGAYRFHEIDRTAGVRAAVHSGWNIARQQIVNYAQRLVNTQALEFGVPPGEGTLMIFTPLPPPLRPPQGVRSSGMVWDRSLLLFAGAGREVPLNSDRVREMIAVFLGHELFHLYVPWGLPVTRSLSWLSEGWAEHVGRTSAQRAGILGASGVYRSLEDAYESYIEMGGARAGSLRQASETESEELRALLYVRGELVFRMLSLEWDASGGNGSFDRVLGHRLQAEYDGSTPLEPAAVSRVLSSMVSPQTVRRLVEGSAMITRPELELGRR